MANVDVVMPQLGETVTEGIVASWYKKVGETVKADEPLFDLETDKVVLEVPAPVAGVLVEVKVAAGSTLKVESLPAEVGSSLELLAADAEEPLVDVLVDVAVVVHPLEELPHERLVAVIARSDEEVGVCVQPRCEIAPASGDRIDVGLRRGGDEGGGAGLRRHDREAHGVPRHGLAREQKLIRGVRAAAAVQSVGDQEDQPPDENNPVEWSHGR